LVTPDYLQSCPEANGNAIADNSYGPTLIAALQVSCIPGSDFSVDFYFRSWSEKKWLSARKEVTAEQDSIAAFLASAGKYPAKTFGGKGIVMVAGGKYLTDALITIAMIREFGCKLRIQLWYAGEAELPESTIVLWEELGVETYDVLDFTGSVELIESNVGFRPFQLKPMALLYSDLEEVLLIDADSTPTKDPSYLFEDERYVKQKRFSLNCRLFSRLFPRYKCHPTRIR
jgi:hypothetical protein